MDEPKDVQENLEEEGDEARMYELSFHLLPTLSQANVDSSVQEIISFITDNKGSLILKSDPQPFVLAYSISKSIKSVKTTYARSFFGWITFSLTGEAVVKFKTMLDKSDSVLRYLLVHAEAPEPETEKKKPAKEEKSEISAEELDKTIDQLVIS